jgi:hypothetical protein
MSTNVPRFVPVMSGRACAGFLISRGPRGIEAYDANEKSLGIFANAIEAAVAFLPSGMVRQVCRGLAGALV